MKLNLKNDMGFSLIELLVTISIFSLLLVLAVPLGREWVIQNRALSAVNTLIAALYYGRSEAIFRSEVITFCPSVDHLHCSGAWRNGQIAVNQTGQVLRVFPALPAADILTWNSSGGMDNKLQWLPVGTTHGQRGTFYYCPSQAPLSFSRDIVVSDSGRIYTTSMTLKEHNVYCAG